MDSNVGKYELITQARATLLLERNAGNRPRSPKLVADYARQMRSGEWGRTSQPIIIGVSGRLIDGQHRLAAVVASGVAQWFLVVYGADENQFLYIDRHKKRNGSDVLAISGEVNTVSLAACLSFIERYELRGAPPPDSRGPTGDRIMSLSKRWPEARDSVSMFISYRRQHPWMKTASTASSHAIATRFCGRDFADAFLNDLAVGTGLHVDDPVWRLRETLVDSRNYKSNFKVDYVFKLTLKAINLRLAGREVKLLRIVPSEGFPVLTSDPSAIHGDGDR